MHQTWVVIGHPNKAAEESVLLPIHAWFTKHQKLFCFIIWSVGIVHNLKRFIYNLIWSLFLQHFQYLQYKTITTFIKASNTFRYVNSIEDLGHGVGGAHVFLSLSSKAVLAGVLHVHVSPSFGEDIPPYISKHLRNLYPSEA